MPYDLCSAECSSATNVCERGWQGFLTDDEYEPARVAILCPSCAVPPPIFASQYRRRSLASLRAVPIPIAVERPHGWGATAGVTYDLFCVECSSATNVCEPGWRGFLTDDEYEPAEIVILCPLCAEREFGPASRKLRSDEN
jgi:hypothetical protein